MVHRARHMSDRPLRILLFEDRPADAELVKLALERAGVPGVTRVADTSDAFADALREFAPDIVLSDHSLARFNAVAALQLLRATRPTVPLIVVAGALDERAAVETLKAGAEDFILKTNLGRLRPAIDAALAVRRPLDRLSPRQVEVLRLLAQGHSMREIAKRLKLSVKTIETHRADVMNRLGIHDVAGLVRYAVRVGLVSPEA